MKKTHIVVVAIVLLLMVSLAFAQQNTVTYGVVAATNTPNGVVVEGEEVTVAMPTRAQRAAQARAYQQQAADKATQAANEASLKKGEPTLRVDTTTTQTDVYNRNVKNKKGTTDYGMVEQTVTGPQGQQTTEGIVYSAYAPSKAARTNAKKMEISVVGGETMPYNKDNQGQRYGTNGFAAGVSVLRDMSDHLAVGVDYMMLHPRSKTHGNGAEQRHYHGMYAHQISLAGKLTFNPWDSLRFYMPMGVGMMNARLKTAADALYENENHWGAAMYAGVGMQYDITTCLFAGLEYRYTYAWVNDKHLTSFYRDRNLQLHNVLMRIGMRF